MQLLTRFFQVALYLSLVTGVTAQASYRPGQTFSSSPSHSPTPTPAAYRPIAPVTAPPMRTPVPRRDASPTSMYNVGTPANRTTTNKKSPDREVKAAPKSKSASASSSAGASSEKLKSKDNAEVTKSTPSTSEESKSASSSPVVESTDKLIFFSRKTGKKQVALTYDDGPIPSYTPKLAEYLKSHNVPATFYLCGNMVKEHPDTARMLVEEGFELGNHSYDHPSLNKLSKEKIVEQLQDTHDLIKEATGVDVKTMRPPYGAQNSTVREVCEQMGYKIIQWDVDTEDWKKRSPSQMLNTIMKQTGDGSIILMHDRKHGSVDSVLETTKNAVEQLRAKGYTFVTISELIELDKPEVSKPEASATTAIPAVLTQTTTSTVVVDSPLPVPSASATPHTPATEPTKAILP